MKNFTYQRLLTNNLWNINNIHDVDAQGVSVTLGERVKAALPGLPFHLTLNSLECLITFEIDLDVNQITTLNATVVTHEAASGTINETEFIYLRSEDGTLWRIFVTDAGVLTTEVSS